jgi:hypothetical protein
MNDETIQPTVNGKVPPPESPKRRGRPPGSKNAPKAEGLNATAIPGDAPKRGRPRKGPTIEFDKEALARSVKGTHGTLAFFLNAPELMLSDKEAEELAGAFADFAREFDFEPNPKIMAAANLIGVAGIVYVPRVIQIARRVKATKAKRPVTVDGQAQPVENPAHEPAVN